MRCHRCDAPLSDFEVEDSEDIGQKYPHCAECNDLAVLG
jgi:hypothetical protein